MNILIELWECDYYTKDKDFVDYEGNKYSSYDVGKIIEELSEKECVDNVVINVNTAQIGSSVIIGKLFEIANKNNISLYFNGVDKDSVLDINSDKRIKKDTRVFEIPNDKPCLALYFVNENLKEYYFNIIPSVDNRVNVMGTFSGPTGSRLTIHCNNCLRNPQLECLLKAPLIPLVSKQKEEGMDACYYRSGEVMSYLLSKYNDNIEEIAKGINKQKATANKR